MLIGDSLEKIYAAFEAEEKEVAKLKNLSAKLLIIIKLP